LGETPETKLGKKTMSPKKTILKALSSHQDGEGSGKLVRPSAIHGFKKAPEKYQRVINTLLKDRLIEGIRDPEGHMAISLNVHRVREIKRALRPFWAHPAVLALMALFATVAGVAFLA
jgi:hypothetical protein